MESNVVEGVTVESEKDKPDINFRLKAGIFLTTVAGLSSAIAFSATLASAKKKDPRFYEKGTAISRNLDESGVQLAFRALKWGTFYAFAGVGLISYGIWKLSGATTLQEFRFKMGSILPRVPKNNPPQGRTEFSGLNDLLNYISHDYGKDSEEKIKD